jgi:hypothetical protein
VFLYVKSSMGALLLPLTLRRRHQHGQSDTTNANLSIFCF